MSSTSRDPEPEPAQPPARCPSCSGRELKTTSKAIDKTTYWRCLTCGEVWNLDRRGSGNRYSYRR
jgi:DNA-directed RNA polymerase subunit RPC12/RpoP